MVWRPTSRMHPWCYRGGATKLDCKVWIFSSCHEISNDFLWRNGGWFHHHLENQTSILLYMTLRTFKTWRNILNIFAALYYNSSSLIPLPAVPSHSCGTPCGEVQYLQGCSRINRHASPYLNKSTVSLQNFLYWYVSNWHRNHLISLPRFYSSFLTRLCTQNQFHLIYSSFLKCFCTQRSA